MGNAKLGLKLPEPVRTPLLRKAGIWVKPEGGQPGGSVKYRMVHAKVKAALEAGHLRPGTVLTEVTSGSTGLALAILGRHLGLPVELHAYETASPAKCERIRREGAYLVLHPASTPFRSLLNEVILKSRQGRHWHLGQYDRASTTAAYHALGEELVGQVREEGLEPPYIFACPVGTGGLIQGVGSRLRRAFPGIKVVAVEPLKGTTIDGMRNTQEAHLGAEDPYDLRFPDGRVTVGPPRTPAVVQGVRLGISGTAVYTAARLYGWDEVLFIAPD